MPYANVPIPAMGTPSSYYSSKNGGSSSSSSSSNGMVTFTPKVSFWNRITDKLGFTNHQQQAEMEAQQSFDQYMANTAVQRKVADMKAAGMNPMVASAQAAAGADSPTTQVPDIGTTIYSDAFKAMTSVAKTVASVALFKGVGAVAKGAKASTAAGVASAKKASKIKPKKGATLKGIKRHPLGGRREFTKTNGTTIKY